MATLGKRNTLKILRAAPPGLYLDGGELGDILLPGALVPKEVQAKDLLDVFVYTDSEDRLVATTETPKAQAGEFATLRVVSINERVGAFLDWGLSKDLLLPFREHEKPLRAGQKVTVFVYVDTQSRRIVASARLARHLSQQPPPYRAGQQVEALITWKTPLGYNAIIENAHRGLLYNDTVAAPLQIGQRLKLYVRNIRDGGKIDLSLDQSGYKRVRPLGDQILEALTASGGKLALDDDSSPEEIRAKLNVSKKAFKQALGALYKQRRIEFTKPGIQLLDNTNFVPGAEAKKQMEVGRKQIVGGAGGPQSPRRPVERKLPSSR